MDFVNPREASEGGENMKGPQSELRGYFRYLVDFRYQRRAESSRFGRIDHTKYASSGLNTESRNGMASGRAKCYEYIPALDEPHLKFTIPVCFELARHRLVGDTPGYARQGQWGLTVTERRYSWATTSVIHSPGG